jgi:hypothetical protein
LQGFILFFSTFISINLLFSGVSSRWLCMVVHQALLHSQSDLQGSFSKLIFVSYTPKDHDVEHMICFVVGVQPNSSSCIAKCNSFSHIFEVVFYHSWFIRSVEEKWSRMRSFNPSFSSLELSWIRFQPKPSRRIVAICGDYQWSKFFLYHFGGRSFHLFIDLKKPNSFR